MPAPVSDDSPWERARNGISSNADQTPRGGEKSDGLRAPCPARDELVQVDEGERPTVVADAANLDLGCHSGALRLVTAASASAPPAATAHATLRPRRNNLCHFKKQDDDQSVTNSWTDYQSVLPCD